MQNGTPILGVVEAPVLNKQYYGFLNNGASILDSGTEFKLDPMPDLDHSKSGIRVVASRSHLNNDTRELSWII